MFLRPGQIRFCRHCGQPATYTVPPGDNRPRASCAACGHIQYENPLNVVGTVPVWGEQVLLCKRAIEPRYGKWTLPAGFMELGETLEQGALRETDEEAGTPVALEGLFALMSVVRVGQVHVYFRARMLQAHWAPGEETLEARLFYEHEVPWDELAFRTVAACLRFYFDDRRAGHFQVHYDDIG